MRVLTVFRFLLLGLLLATSFVSRADRLATYRTTGGDIVLMTEACAAGGRAAQRAYRRRGSGVLEGCWATNEQGNPVVTWRDGQVRELDQSRVRLAPKYAALLDDAEPPAAVQRQRPARRDFPRPGWCRAASHDHERAICRDAALSAADLQLAPLWRAYRSQQKLDKLEQARTKSDYFRRLKACRTDKDCIAREQSAQARFYREALGARAP